MKVRGQTFYECPYCGEDVDPLLELEVSSGEVIQDCSVCCRPITIRFKRDGEELIECFLLTEDDV